MKSICIAFALCASAGAIAQPHAPTISPPTTPGRADPAALAAADRLLTAMDYDRMMMRTTDALVAQMGPSLKKSIEDKIGEPVDDELIGRLVNVQAKFLRTRLGQDPNMRRAIAVLYARHLNATDLDRLAVLYKDPVMQKWSEIAPALMGDMMPLLMDMMNAHRAELEAEAKDTVTDYFAEKGKASKS